MISRRDFLVTLAKLAAIAGGSSMVLLILPGKVFYLAVIRVSPSEILI